ncbi:hypothetical protein MPSEU_000184300 [Mayamaea pseudoterrestris]|nr:hypothetical protein MPSEU_000184300 [Mayamaea pseudoterrestris]
MKERPIPTYPCGHRLQSCRCISNSSTTSETTSDMSKTIFIGVDDEKVMRTRVSGQKSLDNILIKAVGSAHGGMAFLVDEDHRMVRNYKALVESAIYTIESLPPPSDVFPVVPVHAIKPEKYVCPEGFLESLFSQVSRHLEGDERVPPMALVGCSRSGKTALLEEIATRLPDYLAAHGSEPVAIIMITFNDYSPVSLIDHEGALQALGRRLLFSINVKETERNQAFNYYVKAYDTFRRKNYVIALDDIMEWLDGFRVILLIDELNNLDLKHSGDQSEVGDFLRAYFLDDTGRYLVLTSHELGSVDSFADIIDTSKGSSRDVIVQHLPLALNLEDVVLYLNPDLRGPLEALYYGLLPGLIFDQGQRVKVYRKHKAAINTFELRSSEDKRRCITRILASFFTGKENDVPLELRKLVTTRPDLDVAGREVVKISWVPFNLQFVLAMSTLDERNWFDEGLHSLNQLCNHLKTTKESSGKGYEYLFAIAYLARCIAGLPFDNLLPREWFMDSGLEVEFNPYRQEVGGFLEDCCDWDQLEKGIDYSGPQPKLAVFLPTNPRFERFDIVALLITNGRISDRRAFQVQQATHNPSHEPWPGFEHTSFLVKGDSPQRSHTNAKGWNVVGDDDLERFFGESGKHWTPKVWRHLTATYVKARNQRAEEEERAKKLFTSDES